MSTSIGRASGLICSLTALLAFVAPPSTNAAVDVEIAQKIDAVFAQYDDTRSPGCALGVIQEGKLTYQRGYGMASLEHGAAITENTVFYTGSVSKQFVAAAVLMAAREGHLFLDDDIRKYMPEIPDYGETITVRHLVHHTSGLRDYLGLMSLAGIPFVNVMTPERVIDLIARQKAPNFAPGEQYLYSNSGYFLLAQIVGRATSRSLREYSQEKLFGPLDMRHTHFHDDRHQVVQNRALAYGSSPNGFVVDWSPAFDQVGSGGLLSTIEDLVEWDRSFYDERLGEGFWDAMQEKGLLDDGEELAYAFGLTIDEYNGYRRVQHGGAMFGYRAYLSRLPTEHLTVAILCNLGSVNSGGLANQVTDLLLPGTESGAEVAAGKSDEPKTIRLAEKQLEPLTGEYELLPGASVVVHRAEDALFVSPPGASDIPLLALTESRFFIDSPDFGPGENQVRFERDSKGEISAMTMTLFGEERRAEKQAPLETRSEKIDAWIGPYWSEELAATALIEREDDGSLSYRVGTTAPAPIRLRQDGTFQIPGMAATSLGGDKTISGFTIDAGRVRGIDFLRRP